jgi:TerC family integral membrane protein
MQLAFWTWWAFGAFVAAMLVLDLLTFAHRRQAVSVRRAAVWSVAWTLLGLAFVVFVWWWQGRRFGEEYLTGFLLEKSLSVDNLFVFALVLSYFGVPAPYQRRVIFWGIVGAIVLRGAFIVAGAALLESFHYTFYVFGAFLVLTGLRFARRDDIAIEPANSPALRLLSRHARLTDEHAGDRFTVRRNGQRMATPMFGALVLVAAFDVVFAVDSIPAIFAVTRETFIVFAANAFSLLGLGALYFLLVGMMGRFHHLNVGLAAVLVFVGLKMLLADLYEVPIYASLAVIVLTVTLAIGVSLLRPAADESRGRPLEPGPRPPQEASKEQDASLPLVGSTLGSARARSDRGESRSG